MIHDPCIFPQQRSVNRERDDWFLVQVGCFNSGGNTGGGSAGDFDDTVRLEGDTRPEYESQIDKAARDIAGGDNYENVFADNPAAFAELQERIAEASRTPRGAVGDSTPTQFPLMIVTGKHRNLLF